MPALPLPGAQVVDTSAEFRVKPVEPDRGRFCALRMERFLTCESVPTPVTGKVGLSGGTSRPAHICGVAVELRDRPRA